MQADTLKLTEKVHKLVHTCTTVLTSVQHDNMKYNKATSQAAPVLHAPSCRFDDSKLTEEETKNMIFTSVTFIITLKM